MKILIVGAMETELRYLLKKLNAKPGKKLFSLYPVYTASYGNIELFIVQTYVGEMNASVAGTEAIRIIRPDAVLKFGAVGGSYYESQAGDCIVPIGFFHRASWITRSFSSNHPTDDAAQWQSVFGSLPYQVNEENLGGIPYYFSAETGLTRAYIISLKEKKSKFSTAYVGGGNMWMFSKGILDNITRTMLPKNAPSKRFVSDMESYALAYVCHVTGTPFSGCYVIASNDYLDEPYDPGKVAAQMESIAPVLLGTIRKIGNTA